MGKRLCKLSRNEITQSLANIHQLVKQPLYLCRSCARSSSEQQWLCHPEPLPVIEKRQKLRSLPIVDISGRAISASEKQMAKGKMSKKNNALVKKLKKLAKKQKKILLKQANIESKLKK
jgi:hypothetical protein